MTPRSAVAIGGGTGLPLVLRCLLDAGFDTTAVVTMADDGGSSGHLRRELGMLPPGDIRNCLVALADPGNPLAHVFQYRFAAGEGLAGHAIGNLIIAALADIEGGFAEAVAAAGDLLGVRGRVFPSTLADVVLSGRDHAGNLVIGQASVAETDGPIARVCLDPAPAPGYPPALDAIREADVIIIGPGSLFTSIIPNFLVGGVLDALRGSNATVAYVCNVANLRGETAGMDAADHVDALIAHGLEESIDVAIADVPAPGTREVEVACGPAQIDRITAHGIRVVTADLVDPAVPARHDSGRLAAVLTGVW